MSASPGTPPAHTTVVLDISDDTALCDAVAALDPDLCDRIADAVDAARSRRNQAALLRLLRAELADRFPYRPLVGVLFTTDEWDEGHFFDHGGGRVLFTDGDTDRIEFSDAVRALLTDEYGRRGPSCALTVDLRSGEFTDDEETGGDTVMPLVDRFPTPTGTTRAQGEHRP